MKKGKSYGEENITLTILLTNLFIAFLGIGLVIPVTPTIMNELHLSGTAVGYMVACFAITQLIVSPIAGRWVDRFGRKIMIVIGLFFFSVSEFLFGIGKTVEMLFISRMLGGISAAFIMPGSRLLSQISRPLKHGRKRSVICQPLFQQDLLLVPESGIFSRSPLPAAFFFAAAFALLAAILSMLTLREPERNPENQEIKGQKTGFKRIFAPMYFIAFLIILISSFGLASFESLFALYVDHKFGFTASDIAIMITGGAIVGAITQVVLFDRFTRWFWRNSFHSVQLNSLNESGILADNRKFIYCDSAGYSHRFCRI
ncbi:MFS transporter [Bacillus stercoris]|nr:MFS transporter [Bacillus stercoris]